MKKETVALKLAVQSGNAGKHIIKKTIQHGACGVCKWKGSRLWCRKCRVRLCVDTTCLNKHINDGRGSDLGEKVAITEKHSQGQKNKPMDAYNDI